MAKEKAEELRQLGEAELHKRLEDAHEEIFKLRFQKATKQLTNTNRIRDIRHNICRIHTLLRQRELAEGR
jgi:large subunit ribosomal protein L29